jgi:hypothetical protein
MVYVSDAFCLECNKIVAIVWFDEKICDRCGSRLQESEGFFGGVCHICHMCNSDKFKTFRIPRCVICNKKNWEAMAYLDRITGVYTEKSR